MWRRRAALGVLGLWGLVSLARLSLIVAPAVGAPATGIARVSFQPATVDTQLSSTITVTVYGENVADMTAAAAQLKYDPRILRINNIVAGDLPQRGMAESSRTEPSKNILNDSGQADMAVDRGLNGGGISGGGGFFVTNAGGILYTSGAVKVTVSNSIAYSNGVVVGQFPGWTHLGQISWSLGGNTVTGKKYEIGSNHVLTGSAKIPGTVAGTTATGGQAL